MVAEEERLETPKEFAERVGLTVRKVRYLINTKQIEHVWIGSRVHIPKGAYARFIEAKKVTPCQDETRAPVSVGSISATASTSFGLNTVAAASSQRAQATANKLKSLSRNSSIPYGDMMAQVIPLKSS